jgi:hypothetical protein
MPVCAYDGHRQKEHRASHNQHRSEIDDFAKIYDDILMIDALPIRNITEIPLIPSKFTA